MRWKKTIVVILTLALGFPGACTILPARANEKEPPRITKEQLLSMMGSPDVIILDVRESESWKDSDEKIRGAVREEPLEVKNWAKKYPKDKTLILYCS